MLFPFPATSPAKVGTDRKIVRYRSSPCQFCRQKAFGKLPIEAVKSRRAAPSIRRDFSATGGSRFAVDRSLEDSRLWELDPAPSPRVRGHHHHRWTQLGQKCLTRVSRRRQLKSGHRWSAWVFRDDKRQRQRRTVKMNSDQIQHNPSRSNTNTYHRVVRDIFSTCELDSVRLQTGATGCLSHQDFVRQAPVAPRVGATSSLSHLFMIMQAVASSKNQNRMSTSTVAACMAPLLLRPLLAGECEIETDFNVDRPVPIRLLDHFLYAMFCLLVLMCFGDKLDESQIKKIENVQRRLLLAVGKFNILNFWPRLTKIVFFKKWIQFLQMRRDQENVLVPLIRARKKMKEEESLGVNKEEYVLSYVDTLLDLQLHEEKRKLSEEEIVSLCSEFLSAGTESTSTALQWIMANLVKHPHVQEKVYTEIRGVVGENEEVKKEELQEMPYLKAVILEGLRRHPPGHFVLPHAVTEDFVLDDKYVIPKDGSVNFMVADMGWDPKVWEDPMACKLERFLNYHDQDFDITGGREIKMMPFGAGRRICPGFGLAMLHLEYFVANLVWNFEWKAVDGDEVDLTEKQEFTRLLQAAAAANHAQITLQLFVDALNQIAKTMGTRDWTFDANACDLNDILPVQELDPTRNITCNRGLDNTQHITEIQFKHCNLSGTLPPELVQLPSIQKVDFAYNYLNGSIPVEWAMLQLKFISVFGNRLSGDIPSYSADITSLTYLDIEANQFSGTVPQEFRKLVNLGTLRLSSNQLSGSLPTGLAELKNLTDFRISDNNFNGSIPEFIQNWKQLERLEMQGSGLHGPIPPSISVLENLKLLRISDIAVRNHPFPDLRKMAGIITVYAHWLFSIILMEYDYSPYNYLTGLMLDFQNFEKLWDLSFNRLTGKIPNVATPPSLKFMSLNLNLFRSSSGDSNLSGVLPCRNNFKCDRYWHSLHINCGGNDVRVNGSTFEGDGQIGGGAATCHSQDDTNWGFSSSGDFTDDNDEENKRYIATSNSSDLSELYINARIAPLSLTYFGYCLDNRNYMLSLHFAEIQFSNGITFHSLGRRLFDIYIQDKLVERNFDIKAEASGVLKPVARSYNVTVTNHIIEIRFHWAGKGTTALPKRGIYGPLVSAISLNDPNFKPENKKVVPIVVGVVAGLSLIILAFGFMKESDLQTISFTLKQIKAATNNFDSAKKIGEGGFGPVYKGQLADGTIIAVKQLSSKSRQGNREFLNEIAMISCLQHPNLVKIHGCCVEGDQLLLVYEYMENNSLAHALFGGENSQLKLNWSVRQKICLGIARGLAFLHEESRFKIVHRDIKATNVLLDRDLNPKISDFGLAKLDEEEKTHISTRVAGTIGYMAPEYALWGYLTYKADVYSFGVVALEIVSGKYNMSYVPDSNCICPLDWAFHLHRSGTLMELVDPRLGSEFNKVEAERMIKIALLCTNASPSLRPTMSEVVSMLEGSSNIPDVIPEASGLSEDLRFKTLRDHPREMNSSGLEGSLSRYSSSASFLPGSSSFLSGSSPTDDVREINAEAYLKFKAMRDSHIHMERQSSVAQVSTPVPSWTGSSKSAHDVQNHPLASFKFQHSTFL
ncbi:putative LRR receptor-like serine/threonine-protein kinase RFK1 [Citrus sinensis]|uniref:LRR receptor-like serine/threonine-protein kinase RFK1 n=1 Tax=Citrus sinensis TaxID=2711 RepID=A0ACB8NHZ4_CITSI|nr:putative LRR receptor-like serine/threonine-protein kinase RFK1 [Citrus sinensis]